MSVLTEMTCLPGSRDAFERIAAGAADAAAPRIG